MTIIPISETGDHVWPDLLASAPLLLIYKHSPICGASAAARTEVRSIHAAAPRVPVYQVDVIHQRGLSSVIAADLGVGHESPQVILICNGKPVWNASHFRIKAATLVDEIARVREACFGERRSPAPSAA
ncbi:MAG: bacillithiol system redox-active protein YtxJ [Gemmatimonadota bacterium]|nr:bacillithiol system redox-active protein YtxJ [Gemmatimonadota bacterium]